MSELRKILLCFDGRNEYFKLGWDFLYLSDLRKFNKSNINELLINIISNVDEIEKEIITILDRIKKKYKKNESDFSLEETMLEEISDVFHDMLYFANDYALIKKKEKEQKISEKKDSILELEKEIINYDFALEKHSALLIDENKIIENLINKHEKELPSKVKSIWVKRKNKEKNIEMTLKICEDKIKYIKEYLVNNYEEEWDRLVNEYITLYTENLKKMKVRLMLYKKQISRDEKEYETIYYESYVWYLNKILNSVFYIKNCVNAWFGMEYDDVYIKSTIQYDASKGKFDIRCDEIGDWRSFSKEQRLCIQQIYSREWENGMKIPESKIIYAIKKDDGIILLNAYANEQYEKNVGKPFNNIMNNLKKEDLVFLHAYECNDLSEVLNVLFYQLINSNCHVNKCQNCGKYFIPKAKSNEKYCDRTSPQNYDKTCKEYGVNKAYRDEVKSNAIKSMHSNISQAYRMRIKRAKDDEKRKEHMKQFEGYKEKYLIKKENYNSGKLSEEKFLLWLKKQREELKNNGKHNTDEK